MRIPLCLLVLLVACAPTSRLGGPRFPDDTFVLFDPAAKFYVEPQESADHFTFVPSEVVALRLRAEGAFNSYRLVSEGGDWLEVETPGANEDQCAPGASGFEPLKLRLFVRSSDVVLATTRDLYFHFDDGSSARLVAGAPVIGTEVHAGELLLSLVLPQDSVGRAYRGGGRFETPWVTPQPALTGDLTSASVGGRPLHRGANGPLPVYGTRPGLSGTVAKVRTRCVELEALVPPEMVKPISAPNAARANESAKQPYVRAGATIYWKSGRVAGETRKSVDFVDEAGTADGHRCFRWTAAERRQKLDPSALATLCFNPADVTQ